MSVKQDNKKSRREQLSWDLFCRWTDAFWVPKAALRKSGGQIDVGYSLVLNGRGNLFYLFCVLDCVRDVALCSRGCAAAALEVLLL